MTATGPPSGGRPTTQEVRFVQLVALLAKMRLITGDQLRKMVEAPLPLNPLAFSGGGPGVHNYSGEFARILKEGVHWPTVQEGLVPLLSESDVQRQREAENRTETSPIFAPILEAAGPRSGVVTSAAQLTIGDKRFLFVGTENGQLQTFEWTDDAVKHVGDYSLGAGRCNPVVTCKWKDRSLVGVSHPLRGFVLLDYSQPDRPNVLLREGAWKGHSGAVVGRREELITLLAGGDEGLSFVRSGQGACHHTQLVPETKRMVFYIPSIWADDEHIWAAAATADRALVVAHCGDQRTPSVLKMQTEDSLAPSAPTIVNTRHGPRIVARSRTGLFWLFDPTGASHSGRSVAAKKLRVDSVGIRGYVSAGHLLIDAQSLVVAGGADARLFLVNVEAPDKPVAVTTLSGPLIAAPSVIQTPSGAGRQSRCFVAVSTARGLSFIDWTRLDAPSQRLAPDTNQGETGIGAFTSAREGSEVHYVSATGSRVTVFQVFGPVPGGS